MVKKTIVAFPVFLAFLLLFAFTGFALAQGTDENNSACTQSCSSAYNSCKSPCEADYGTSSSNRGSYISDPIEVKCSGSHEAATIVAGSCYQQSTDTLGSCMTACAENTACGSACVETYNTRNINVCGSQYLDYCYTKCSDACTAAYSVCTTSCPPLTQNNLSENLTIPRQNATQNVSTCTTNCNPDQQNQSGNFTIPLQNATANESAKKHYCELSIAKYFDGVSADGVSSIEFTLNIVGDYDSFTFNLVPGEGEVLRGTITRPNPTTIIFTPFEAGPNKNYLPAQLATAVAECIPKGGTAKDKVVSSTPFTIEQPPLFFVHGYSSSAADVWPDFEARASAQGWQFEDITYPGTQDIALSAIQLASELRNFLQRIHDGEFYGKKKISATKVDIVSHSMGGLVTRRYIGSIYQGDIRKFIMLGTPNAGSWFANLGSGMASTQLQPNSQFLQTLNSQALNPSIDYHTIAGTGWSTHVAAATWNSDGDGIVLANSVRLPGVPLYCTWDAHSSSTYWSTKNTPANANGGGAFSSDGGTITTSDASWGITTSAILTGTATTVAPCPPAPAAGGAGTGAAGGQQGVSGTVRSPAILHAYDESGNHIGPKENGELENTIGSGAYYSDGNETDGHQKIIIYGDRQVKFVIKGTDEGEFGFDFEKWNSEGEIIASKSFENVKTNANTQHKMDSSAEKIELVKQTQAQGSGIPCPPALGVIGLLLFVYARKNKRA